MSDNDICIHNLFLLEFNTTRIEICRLRQRQEDVRINSGECALPSSFIISVKSFRYILK